MIKKYFLLILCCFPFCISFSQNIIKGKVSNDQNQPIISASVILKDANEKIVEYTFSDDKGNYNLSTNKTGSFILFVSSIGFEDNMNAFNLNNKSEIKNLDFVLISKEIELKEILIESKRPITIKKDTIVFDADYFKQGNEEVVEDLLKKIPGLHIDANGTIIVGNQEVEKVMINNDDMFGKGYKILTKNMPVNPIDKIELLQNYSNNKHLKGIENSNKVALNLILKEDYKRNWFGNLSLGYGLVSENRYAAKANLMNFGNKSKYYFLTNLNNTGYDAVGDINNLIRPYSSDDISTIGDEESANAVLSSDNFYVPKLKQKRINFNNTEMLSLNSIFTLSDKVKLKLLGFFNTDENDFFKNSFQSYSVGTISFENTEDFVGRKVQITGFGKIDLTYDISKTKTFEYIGKFNKTQTKNRSELLFNNEFLNERLYSNNQLIDQKMVLTNKFTENKVLLLTGRYINENTPQNFMINQFLYSDLFTENANNTAQFSENKMQFAGFEAHIMDRKQNEDLLELKLVMQYRNDNLRSVFQLKNNQTIVAKPDSYQNNFVYKTNDLYLSAKYQFNFENVSVLTQADLHQVFNKLENQVEKKNQNPFFINPKLGLNWNINEKNKILTSYSYNTTNAKTLDVYSNYVQTGFRSFTKGTNNFTQLNASNFILNYTLGNWGDKFFVNTFVLYTKNHDFFSTNSLVSQNVTQSERIVIKDRNFLSVSSSLDRYFKPIKNNLKLNLGISQINFKNIVNNSDLREVKNNGFEYGFELRSGFRGFFNYHLGSKWNYNEVKTSISNSFTDNMSFLDLSFKISDKFNIQTQTECYHFGNLENNTNTYYFMDLESRYVIKENKLSVSVSGNNLFNIKTFKNYNITDISVSKTEYRLLPRYVLLKMEYRF